MTTTVAPTKPKPKAKPQARKILRDSPGPNPRQVTSARISADLEAFQKAGGRIEVLGVTRVLTKIDAPPKES